MDNKENQIPELYAKYQGAEGQAKSSNAARREAGLALGKALFDLRAEAEVVSGGTTFDSTLKTLGVPHRTAYRWIKKYELSVGIRSPVDVKVDGETVEVGRLYYDPKDPLSRSDRKSAIKLCSEARKISCDYLSVLVSPDKAQRCVVACEDREQLELLVQDLEILKRRLDRCLPVIAAVLAATPTDEDKVKIAARMRAVPAWDDNSAQDSIQ